MILFMTVLSYITNLFLSHGSIHNSIFLAVGFIAFLSILKKLFRKIKLILLVSLILFIGILMHKTHDDFTIITLIQSH